MNFYLIILFFISIEIVLRLYERSKNLLVRDLSYPFYTFKPNSYGRSPVYVNTLGKKKTPKIRIYTEGIRSDIKNEKRKKILMLGCSVTEGAAHIDSETYPGQLQKLVNSNKHTVINAGVPGYGIFQVTNLFKKLIKFRPEIVILQIPSFERYPINKQKLRKKKRNLVFMRRLKKISLLLWKIFSIFNRNILHMHDGYLVKNKSIDLWKLNKRYLDEIKEICNKNNIKIVIFQWGKSKKVKDYASKNNLYSFDVTKILSYYNYYELMILPDPHPSYLANKLVAKATYNCLIKNKLITS